MPEAFDRLAPHLQRWIYRQRWDELRPMQVDAIQAVLDTDDHVLLAGQTASGKTEAAFLPVLTDLHARPSSGVGVLYIGPLKALINDQFERLQMLLEAAEVPVWAWHGDIGTTKKRKLLEAPSGVLQITPESLEGFLRHRKEHLPRLFSDLRYVLIDEVHAFMGSDRGRQVQCQLARLRSLVGARPRRIGLSATLGDYGLAEAWLAAGDEQRGVVTLEGESTRRVRLALEHFTLAPEKTGGGTTRPDEPAPAGGALPTPEGFEPDPAPSEEHDEGEDPEEERLFDDIYRRTRLGKSLVFANSRATVEKVTAALRARAAHRGTVDIYHAHHGSISKEYRFAAEEAMRDPDKNACTVATVTLELGIDLGALERVVQLNAPGSVSSFVQRAGRTGRRGQAGEVALLTTGTRPREDDHPLSRLPWDLLKAVASIDLYIKERWIEPIPAPTLPVSLLYQQTLGVLDQIGDVTPKELAGIILNLPPFQQVGKERYKRFLQHLMATKHLEFSAERTLLIAEQGDRVIHHYSSLATFEDTSDYAVTHQSDHIGRFAGAPPDNTLIRLAGRTWRVILTDPVAKTVFVEPARGTAVTLWLGDGPDTHARVAQRMHDLLAGAERFGYLMPHATETLEGARTLAHASGVLTQRTLPVEDGTLLLPWTGSREYRGLQLHLNAVLGKGVATSFLDPVALLVRAAPGEIERALATPVPLERLAELVPGDELGSLGKYARYAPDELEREAYVLDRTTPPDIPPATPAPSSATSRGAA